ncbi:FAD-binding protein [Celeribacter litoreus]|uniref:FAD-binding protein n=1 Tax=Celeribacter litoreus TaxID=2876714 RepID=UPI001CCF6497|nr:FAD-binding oxidoreductase [Celeribacter litoreus]MCA0044055.1 FAD-binding oxidoreductase [Celeribacter litoreus]
MTWNNISYSGWGRAQSATGPVARPERQAALIRQASETLAPAHGQRRSYGDVALRDGAHAYDMTRLDRVLALDSQTGIVHVEGGLLIGDLARACAPRGWLPPVMPGTGYATIGGCIANDVHGKNHHEVGTFGAHVTEITLIHARGEKTITPKSGATWRATIGGLGQTGIIARAKIQLIPCAGEVMQLRERRIANFNAFLSAFDESKAPYTVGWVDATARGDALGRGIFEESEVVSGVAERDDTSKSVPLNAPRWALSAPVVRAFNTAYFNRVPENGRSSVKPISKVLFPLDAILEWNKLYGKQGFHQFQCVVPAENADVLREMLDQIAASRLASPLAVLKKTGAAGTGYLSFPMAGYTLAVDFPNRQDASDLITDLIDRTRLADGRIYFAKDSLARADQLEGMYPDLEKWQTATSKVDPNGALSTDLVKRLKLREAADA